MHACFLNTTFEILKTKANRSPENYHSNQWNKHETTKHFLTVRPTYHWSLNKLMGDRIPGSPGPAIRTHGEMVAIRGGLHLNGHNAWLGAGDFSGGCISGMMALVFS